jgi:wobble nucleotide-excising tRNase
MRLRKFTAIKGVGRFKSARIAGGEYDKFTLIYGGNGRGKSTLCAILRSLQRNDPKLIQRRKSFTASSEPEVTLLCDSGPVRYSASAWSAPQPDIHIFDEEFVAENVHGGSQIDVDHRRNFYRIVVGPTGVALAADVDRLDDNATAKQSEITTARRVLEQHLPKGLKLEAFLKLAADAAIDDKINDANKLLKAIDDKDVITKRTLLGVPALPALPEGFLELLAKGVEGITADAARRVQQQLTRHGFRDGGEGWLADGLPHVVDDNCPFCARKFDEGGLLEAYRGYFSAAYEEHKRAIDTMATGLDNALAAAPVLKVEQGFRQLVADAEFWAGYCDHGFNALDPAERLSTEGAAFYAAAKAMLEAKTAAPLEPVSSSLDFINAQARWVATGEELKVDAAALAEANRRIQAVKTVDGATDKATTEATLAHLEATKKRHGPPVAGLASDYEKLLEEKRSLVKEKETKKDALDAYDEAILGAYEADINGFLTRFGASFRLARCAKNYVGKVPQSTYCLAFDGRDVDVTSSGPDEPSFGTTMSAGDKNTFALAFFMSQLKRDADIQKKLVVFDDPFTSLDDFRRAMTAKEIVRIGDAGRAAQVIVLSHDKFFLDTIWGLIHGQPCSPLQISGSISGSSIEPWDIQREVQEGYLQDHMRLQDFAESRAGSGRDMRMVMRPLLERYIRYRFPNQILEGKWLGDMLAIIRADSSHPLTPQYNDLDDINTFTAPFHHDPNTAFEEEEVRTYARRTIAIVGGC